MKYGDLHTTKNWRQIQAELKDELRKWDIDQYLLPYKDDSVRRGSVTVTVFIEGEERRLTCADSRMGTDRNGTTRRSCWQSGRPG